MSAPHSMPLRLTSLHLIPHLSLILPPLALYQSARQSLSLGMSRNITNSRSRVHGGGAPRTLSTPHTLSTPRTAALQQHQCSQSFFAYRLKSAIKGANTAVAKVIRL